MVFALLWWSPSWIGRKPSGAAPSGATAGEASEVDIENGTGSGREEGGMQTETGSEAQRTATMDRTSTIEKEENRVGGVGHGHDSLNKQVKVEEIIEEEVEAEEVNEAPNRPTITVTYHA